MNPSPPQPEQETAEKEPRLKYQRLDGDVPSVLKAHAASCLCVSDKILALGTQNGGVHLLDYAGNEIKVYKEHSARVTDLSFDGKAEYLASCSADGTIVVSGLYTGELQKYKYKVPIETVALDPRYGQRKTREFVYGTAAGTLVLSSKGWLGPKETILVQGRGGPIQAARMAGTLLAWAGPTGLRVYDTATHTRVGKLQLPPSVKQWKAAAAAAAAAAAGGPAAAAAGSAASGSGRSSSGGGPAAGAAGGGSGGGSASASASAGPAPCSLYWMGDRELYCSWGRQVTVLRVVDNPVPASHSPLGLPSKSLQILASFEVPYLLGGAAPFGPSALAVLALNPPAPPQHAEQAQQAQQDAGDAEAAGSRAGPEGAAASTAQQGTALAAGTEGAAATDGSMQQQQQQQQQQQAPTPPPLSLKLLSRSGRELASDAIEVPGLARLLDARAAAAASTAAGGSGSGSGSDAAAVWPPPALLRQLCACRLEVFYTASSASATAAAAPAPSIQQQQHLRSGAYTPGGFGMLSPGGGGGLTRSNSVASTMSAMSAYTPVSLPPPELLLQQTPPALARPGAQQAQQAQHARRRSTASSTATAPAAAAGAPEGLSQEAAAELAGGSPPAQLTLSPLPTPTAAGAGGGSRFNPGLRISVEDSWGSLASPEAPTPATPLGGLAAFLAAAAEGGGGWGGISGGEDPLLQYKWWRDGDEPQYYIVAPGGVVVGRPRDGNDRVSWLVDRRRFREALAVASTDRTVKPGVRERVGEEYLQILMTDCKYEEAAALCPDILGSNALAWERWVYTFAQLRQLAALAGFLPTDNPRLKPGTYDMVLRAFLLAPADHPLLLELVKRWPADAYTAKQLHEAVQSRVRSPGGETPALQRVAALLFTQQRKYEPALRIYLQQRDPSVFDFVSHHALLGVLAPYAAELVDVDEVRGTSLLVEHHEEIPPAAVVAALQAAADSTLDSADSEGPEGPSSGVGGVGTGGESGSGGGSGDGLGAGGGERELPQQQQQQGEQLVQQGQQEGAGESQRGAGKVGRRGWRRRLHTYLDWLFERDQAAGAEFASLQVDLYAEFEPGRLLQFLMLSPSYPLDHAYKVCEARGLVREMVFVLGRMGSADKALRLIVQGLRDVEQAVEFVQLQRDEELWGLLISLALGDAELTGSLLDHAGGYVDPLRVISQLPPELAVPRLRSRLVKVIADFRTSQSLQQGCHAILRADCIALANRLYRLLREALPRVHLKNAEGLAAAADAGGLGSLGPPSAAGGGQWMLYDTASGKLALEAAPAAAAAGLGEAGEGTGDAAGQGAGGGGVGVGLGGKAPAAPQRVWIGYEGRKGRGGKGRKGGKGASPSPKSSRGQGVAGDAGKGGTPGRKGDGRRGGGKGGGGEGREGGAAADGMAGRPRAVLVS